MEFEMEFEKAWHMHGQNPAAFYKGDVKECWLYGVRCTYEEFLAKTSPASTVSCAGKIVEFDGKKYRLEEVK